MNHFLQIIFCALLTLSVTVHAQIASNAIPQPVWYEDWDTGMAAAKAAGKPVLVDFYTDNCPGCVWMEENVFSAPDIKSQLAKSWVTIKVNLFDDRKATVSGKMLTYNELRNHFRVVGVPSFVFFDRTGKPVQQIEGGKPKDLFALILDYMHDEVYAKNITFADYRKGLAKPKH